MATVDMEPNGEEVTDWPDGTGVTFAEVDEGAIGNNGDTDYIAGAGLSSNKTARFTLTPAPSDFGSTNLVTLRVAHRALNFNDDNDYFVCYLLDGFGILGSKKTVTRHDSGTYIVDSFTDSNWDIMTKVQLDAARVQVVYVRSSTGMPDPGREIRVSAMTLSLDYDIAVADGQPGIHGGTRWWPDEKY